jgi:hypothetical protein
MRVRKYEILPMENTWRVECLASPPERVGETDQEAFVILAVTEEEAHRAIRFAMANAEVPLFDLYEATCDYLSRARRALS